MHFDRHVAPREFESSPSALIDVIFQLVLFFVFSLSFLGEERQLHASLPKDRGFSGPSFGTRELVLALAWRDGETSCSTATYYPQEGGSPIEGYTFPQDPGLRVFTGPSGAQQKATATTMRDRSGRSWKVEYDHGVPDMARVEAYLASVKRRLETLGGGLPSVTVQFDSRVPWQDVASILDACLRVGIESVAIGAAEAAP